MIPCRHCRKRVPTRYGYCAGCQEQKAAGTMRRRVLKDWRGEGLSDRDAYAARLAAIDPERAARVFHYADRAARREDLFA